MAIHAAGQVLNVATDFAAGNFNITFQVVLSNGTQDLQTSGFAQVSFALNDKKSDKAIREAMAAKVLADHSITIDPDDIYIPFS